MSVSEIISQAIETGEDNAVHLSELVQLSGLSERDTRRVIEALRRRGEVICSNKQGYYRPASSEELRRYLRQEQARSRSIYRRTASARKQLQMWERDSIFDGITLFDERNGDHD